MLQHRYRGRASPLEESGTGNNTISIFELCFRRLLTSGTTSLNHGSGESSSAYHFAFADPTSFVRVSIWHSLQLAVCGGTLLHRPTLEMHAGFWIMCREVFQWTPCVFFPSSTYCTTNSFTIVPCGQLPHSAIFLGVHDSRHIVCSGPW